MATIAVKDANNNTQVIPVLPASGPANAASSLPVVLAIDGTLPLPEGAATSALQTALDSKTGTVADAATPDITAANASFTFISLYKGMVANLTAIRASLSGVLKVGGTKARAYASFTRPANTTPYAMGQLVANATAAASVAPLQLAVARVQGGTASFTAVKLSKTSSPLSGASFRVHFYRNVPSATNGDGGSWLTTSSIYLGFADVTMDKVFTDQANGFGLVHDSSGNARTIFVDTPPNSQLIYALIEARDAYTPASGETFTLTVEVSQD